MFLIWEINIFLLLSVWASLFFSFCSLIDLKSWGEEPGRTDKGEKIKRNEEEKDDTEQSC